jgi:hypothetical protein
MSFANASKHDCEYITAAQEYPIGDSAMCWRKYFTSLRQRSFPARRSAGRVCRIIGSRLDLRDRLAASGGAAAQISLQWARGASPAINTR